MFGEQECGVDDFVFLYVPIQHACMSCDQLHAMKACQNQQQEVQQQGQGGGKETERRREGEGNWLHSKAKGCCC